MATKEIKVSVSVSSFASTFEGNQGVRGRIPTLWDSFSTANGTNCFTENTGADNYPIVPLNWGGRVAPMANRMKHGVVVQKVEYIAPITIDLTKL